MATIDSQTILQVFILVGSSIIWFIRLEAKTNYNDGRLKELEEHFLKHKDTVTQQLTEIKQSLAKIEGFLSGKDLK